MGNRLQVSHVAATAPEKFSGVPHQDATQQAGYGPQFETFLRDAQRTVSAAPTHAAPWQALDFLKTGGVPRVHREAGRDLFARLRTWLRSSQTVEHALPPVAPPQLFVPVAAQESMRGPVTRGQALAITSPQAITGIGEMTGPMALDEYPHPPQDNGRGMHWIPTLGSPPNVVDRFVRELQNMHMKWSVFLNDGTNVGTNDYLVRKLVSAGIMPVMRVYTPGLVPLEGDLESMVRHYVNLGVRYFQLYNEPNLTVETGGRAPNVNRYLDLWLPAAKTVTKAGGLPGFGALSPQGEYDDRKFLRDALRAIKERGEVSALDHAWLAIHNYTGPRPLSDPDGFLRFEQYHQIMQEELGRSLPIIGTEGGTQVTDRVSNEQQVQMVTGAYDYMRHRQPYNFAYTYWLLANEAGGGRDPEFSRYALFRPDGPSPLVDALKAMA